MGYLGHFIVYVLAMLSVIVLALFVYKKFNMSNFDNKKSGNLSVEEVLSLSPRKNLYIINANGERFLIAGDMDRTTLISKLSNDYTNVIKEQVDNFSKREDILLAEEKQPVMKKLVEKLSGRF